MLAGCQRLISLPPWTTCLFGPLTFILRTLEIFDRNGCRPQQVLLPTIEIFDLPLPVASDPNEAVAPRFAALPVTPDRLPDKDNTLQLIKSLFGRSHPLINFLHEQHFRDMVKILYNQFHDQRDACTRFLPLFHHALALGHLFHREQHRERGCDIALKDARYHFYTGQKLLDITQTDNMISVQALVCGAVFLISTSRMSRAHALLSLASSGAIRLGLHCDVTTKPHISSEDRSMRMLVFIALAKLDAYTHLILDLPRLLPESLVDTGVNSYYATFGNGSKPELDPDMESSIKHLELLNFTGAARRAVFTDAATGEAVDAIKLSHLGAIEKNLQHWTQDISVLLARIAKRDNNSM